MPRLLDHLVLAAHDLAAQADIYSRMGFTVGARNLHPWGTENHIIQFKQSFLELIALGKGFAQHSDDNVFAHFVGESLNKREGLAMLSLRAQDAGADAAAFAAMGMSDGKPFHFGRKARKADGGEVEVAFTLAFAQNPAIKEAGFFTCQQHFPENFWNPAFQTHANGASAVTGILMQAEAPSAVTPFLETFAGTKATASGEVTMLTLAADQDLAVMLPDLAKRLYGAALPQDLPRSPNFVGASIAVESAARLRTVLDAGQIRYECQQEVTIVPAAEVCGIMLIFAPTKGETL
jgi:hypothetical protein